jgi:hypothetical protein
MAYVFHANTKSEKNLGLIALLFLAFTPIDGSATENKDWQFPVRIGQTKYEVYEVLGIPESKVTKNSFTDKEISKHWESENPDMSLEYFKSGPVVKFKGDTCVRVSTQNLTGNKGEAIYEGPIYKGLTIRDNRPILLKKLGKPTSMETDPLSKDVNPDSTVVFASSADYKWDMGTFVIQATVLNQAEGKLKKDEIKFVTIYDKKYPK